MKLYLSLNVNPRLAVAARPGCQSAYLCGISVKRGLWR
jgi:hypothetical protein